MSATENADLASWLGREFLTWLWFESERNSTHVELENFGAISINFGQSLVLEASGLGADGNTVKSDAPTQAEEARTALRTGKKVAKTRILIDHGEQHYEVSFSAETFTFGSVKLPTVLTSVDDERLGERLALFNRVEAIFDGLFVKFVRLRMDSDVWPEVRAAMYRWVTAPSE